MAQLPIAIKATVEQERLERQATEDLAAALQKWAAALLRNVNSFNLNTMLDRLNNPRWAGNIAMRDALIAIMQRAAEVGVDAGIEALYNGNATKAQPVIDVGGVDWELVNVDAAEWALNYSHLLMNDISSTTRRAIQREIAYYVENSMTINQLRDRIMSLSTFSETRANRIAVTETTRAYAEGNMRAWSDLDYVERVRWQTANDDLVCPICGPLNQQTVAKGELFAGRYYSPPAHVNCRCGVSPVVTGAEDAGGAPGVPEPAAGPLLQHLTDEEQARLIKWYERGQQARKDDVNGGYDFGSDAVSMQKEQIVNDLARRAGIPYQKANDFVRQWAKSSNDTDYRSLSIQEAASREFGIPLSTWQKEKIANTGASLPERLRMGKDRAQHIFEYMNDKDSVADRTVRAIYEKTQADLAAGGIDRVTVYRGIKRLPQEQWDQMARGGIINLEGNVIESYAIIEDVANDFAQGANSIVVKTTVPASEVYSTARTGVGCLNEFEFVLLNNPNRLYEVVDVINYGSN